VQIPTPHLLKFLKPNGKTLGGKYMTGITKLTNQQYKVLVWLDWEMCSNYYRIQEDTGLDRKTLKAVIKELKDAGLVVYQRGLMTEDGLAAGSGFCQNYKKIMQINVLMQEYEKQNPS
jgi:hypothetical protein